MAAAELGEGVAAKRNMPLARHQPGGRIQPDPAGARQIHLRPGMQIGEILRRAGRPAIDRFYIGDELNEIARDEPRGEPQMAQQIAPAARRNRGRSPCAVSVFSGDQTPGSMRTT